MFRTGRGVSRQEDHSPARSVDARDTPFPSAASPNPAAKGWHTTRTPYSLPPESARCTPAHPDAAGYKLALVRSGAGTVFSAANKSGQSGAFSRPVRRIYQGVTSGESLRTLYAATCDSARTPSNHSEIPPVGSTCG
ncbi:hypothetical protein TgHK011_008454 [Trichoderma gracile]|nr:hypothetical protein TgHK011_008454 [Trichoderma gracile]